MKTKKIPFNIEKAKAGAKIVTKNGLNVTIRAYLDDKSYNYPIEAIVKNPTGTSKDTLYYSKDGRLLSSGECNLDLFIEEEEPDYNPYKETVKSIADMVERYSELQSLEDLKDFYYNIKVKCREAIEYDSTWNKKELHKIEEVKKRRMTNQELAWWLRDCFEEHREFMITEDGAIFDSHIYYIEETNEPVKNGVVIRRNGGEWQEPLIEI